MILKKESRSHNKCFDDNFGYRQKPSQSTAVVRNIAEPT